jgi:mannose-6-phosphate isomerase-like protein (cupin superfamily)
MKQRLESKSKILYMPTKLIYITLQNEAYRRIIGVDNKGNQFSVMKLKPGESTDMEIHKNTDQMFYIVQGTCLLDFSLEDGRFSKIIYQEQQGFIIKKKTSHNITNNGTNDLKFITKYIGERLHENNLVEHTKPKN